MMFNHFVLTILKYIMIYVITIILNLRYVYSRWNFCYHPIEVYFAGHDISAPVDVDRICNKAKCGSIFASIHFYCSFNTFDAGFNLTITLML